MDEEIERSEAEASVVGRAGRLAVTRVDIYLTVSQNGRAPGGWISVRNQRHRGL